MVQVVSVSLGSSARDSRHQMKLMGEDVLIERRGTDGDLARAKEILRDLDGRVDAIGLGGISFHLYAGQRKYAIREAMELARVVKKTPLVDGGGVKNSLECSLPALVQAEQGVQLSGKTALLVSAVDRFSLGEALEAAGCKMVIGDVVYALGLPVPLHSMRSIQRLGELLLPVMTQLPLAWLYPTGKEQEKQTAGSKGMELLSTADIIAGDYHYIRKHLPPSLAGKVIITNTVTAQDRAMLSERGPVLLVVTSPNFGGRSFATNVIEALIVAMSGRPAAELTREEFRDYALAMGLKPTVERLCPTDKLLDDRR